MEDIYKLNKTEIQAIIQGNEREARLNDAIREHQRLLLEVFAEISEKAGLPTEAIGTTHWVQDGVVRVNPNYVAPLTETEVDPSMSAPETDNTSGNVVSINRRGRKAKDVRAPEQSKV